MAQDVRAEQAAGGPLGHKLDHPFFILQRTLSRLRSTPSRAASRGAAAKAAGYRNIFVGMQPTFRHVPPNTPPSIMATLL